MIGLPFPDPCTTLHVDDDGDEWVVRFALFGKLRSGHYEAEPHGYVLTVDNESDECGACLRGECVQRIVLLISSGEMYCVHSEQTELS